jgi:MinD superfamily P-loop ATPase
MHELAVISGKGGTGKTSVVASLAALAGRSVLADCDVEAADLDLLLAPTTVRRTDFFSGHVAVVRSEECLACGDCLQHCRFDAVQMSLNDEAEPIYWIDPIACEGCGTCVHFCPTQAIDFPERHAGEWFVSQTRYGPLVHARLRAAQGNSGKLVSTVRQEAKRIATDLGLPLIIMDGPPGIGCPVIASITGSSLALVVTEPTTSGVHDLERVLHLAAHFAIPVTVCINKCDLNSSMSEEIERTTQSNGATVAGRIRYDPQVTRAQLAARALVELDCPAADDMRLLWHNLKGIAGTHGVKLEPEVHGAGIT